MIGGFGAAGMPVALLPGGSYFHSADSFAMMRAGHIDIAVLGAFQVAANGDLANWHTGGEDDILAVGGAMDLAVGTRQTWVMMELLTKSGDSKLVARCTYPLTGVACVSRAHTDLAVIDVAAHGFKLVEVVAGLSLAELNALSKLSIAP